MNDLQIEVMFKILFQKLEKIDIKQNIIIEQLTSTNKALADNFDLPIEEGECTPDEFIGISN